MHKSTRSSPSNDAVAQAAAEGALTAFSPVKKLTAIAGLAGFVLRLFGRSGDSAGALSASFRPSTGHLPAIFRQGCRQPAAAAAPAPVPPGTRQWGPPS